MAQRDAARAQVETLLDWARLWERDEQEGAAEVTFLLRRAARQIGMTMDLGIPVEVADKAPVTDVTEEARLG